MGGGGIESYRKQVDDRWQRFARAPQRRVLFFRHFERFYGGHLKVWDYFQHTRAHSGYSPYIHFSKESRWESDNPWLRMRQSGRILPQPFLAPDILFVEGAADWPLVPQRLLDDSEVPVLNLVQHVRHAEARDERYRFLSRRAIRLCVSAPVAQAVQATARANGPIITVPLGLDGAALPPARPWDGKRTAVLIAALKNPALGRAVASTLRWPGVRLLDERLGRAEFLEAMNDARVVLCLPSPGINEGFYLPALEAMALGAVVVCPDAVGNREYCVDQRNCLMPDARVETLIAAVEEAERLDAGRREALLADGRATAERFSLSRERQAFHSILDRIDELWSNTQLDWR